MLGRLKVGGVVLREYYVNNIIGRIGDMWLGFSMKYLEIFKYLKMV